MPGSVTVAVVAGPWTGLAASGPLNDDTVRPGPYGLLGFGVFLFLGLALWLLMRSMRKQLGRIDERLPRRGEEPAADESEAEPQVAAPAPGAPPADPPQVSG